jgi:hypothetical protein
LGLLKSLLNSLPDRAASYPRAIAAQRCWLAHECLHALLPDRMHDGVFRAGLVRLLADEFWVSREHALKLAAERGLAVAF